MGTCPCCSDRLLRHTRHNQLSWFCRSCWQEMPLMQEKSASYLGLERLQQQQRLELGTIAGDSR